MPGTVLGTNTNPLQAESKYGFLFFKIMGVLYIYILYDY